MNASQSLDLAFDSSTARQLEAWDSEGGAPGTSMQVPDGAAAAARSMHRRLLARLGAALLSQWARVPMPLQRAIYNHAVGGDSIHPVSARTRRMARFVHVHGCHGQRARRA